MKAKASTYTLRISPAQLDKLRYIADDNFRTINKELLLIINQHINRYEAEHGEIKPHYPEK